MKSTKPVKAVVKKTATATVKTTKVAKAIPNFITLGVAKEMVLKAKKSGGHPPIHFSAAIIKMILETSNVKGLRIYPAINSNGEPAFVLTGYKNNLDDVYITTIDANGATALGAGDLGQICDPVNKLYGKEKPVILLTN